MEDSQLFFGCDAEKRQTNIELRRICFPRSFCFQISLIYSFLYYSYYYYEIHSQIGFILNFYAIAELLAPPQATPRPIRFLFRARAKESIQMVPHDGKK